MNRIIRRLIRLNNSTCSALHSKCLTTYFERFPGITRHFSIDTAISYTCNECGKGYTKWQGQCYSCDSWNSIVEKEVTVSPSTSSSNRLYGLKKIQPLTLGEIVPNAYSRIQLSGSELNRVLGGGIVPGSMILIGGEPGIGKSTLLLKIASDICNSKRGGVLYVSGEENENQIKLRCDRLGVMNDNLYLIHETNLDSIIHLITQNSSMYAAIIIDSIQTVELQGCSSSSGSINQIRLCTSQLQEVAKSLHISIFITGHVTKTGDLAGPRTLEHIVDTVLYLEGDPITHMRMLRCTKNRFGESREIGVFDMNKTGLMEKTDLYSCFLTNVPKNGSDSQSVPLLSEGSCVGITLNGSSSIPVEFQALINKVNTTYRPPLYRSIGVLNDRLQMLLAVLKSKENIAIGNYDLFVSVVGGIQVFESASDLPVVISLVSALKKESILSTTCFVGEVGLTGELRPVPQLESRLKIAASLGFQQCYTSFVKGSTLKDTYGTMDVIQLKRLRDVLDHVFKSSIVCLSKHLTQCISPVIFVL